GVAALATDVPVPRSRGGGQRVERTSRRLPVVRDGASPELGRRTPRPRRTGGVVQRDRAQISRASRSMAGAQTRPPVALHASTGGKEPAPSPCFDWWARSSAVIAGFHAVHASPPASISPRVAKYQ